MGLIPAHAGKTSYRATHRGHSAAHPRSRGENRRSCLICSMILGSSPLTRGKPVTHGGDGAPERLIPAHAGKTVFTSWAVCKMRAHPRSRGENPLTASALPSCPGSSPLTRGKQNLVTKSRYSLGLIPAHAGKTRTTRRRVARRRAHPRSRGENKCVVCDRWLVLGSSPLTRGKPRPRTPRARGRRLIPAHAGKTRRRFIALIPGKAHPRSRGENRLCD